MNTSRLKVTLALKTSRNVNGASVTGFRSKFLLVAHSMEDLFWPITSSRSAVPHDLLLVPWVVISSGFKWGNSQNEGERTGIFWVLLCAKLMPGTFFTEVLWDENVLIPVLQKVLKITQPCLSRTRPVFLLLSCSPSPPIPFRGSGGYIRAAVSWLEWRKRKRIIQSFIQHIFVYARYTDICIFVYVCSRCVLNQTGFLSFI